MVWSNSTRVPSHASSESKSSGKINFVMGIWLFEFTISKADTFVNCNLLLLLVSVAVIRTLSPMLTYFVVCSTKIPFSSCIKKPPI